MTIFFSPHLDDAVLSCGELLQTCKPVNVVTVFAGRPPSAELPLTQFDANSGFKTPGEAMATRTRENHRACTVLGVEFNTELSFLDRQYGGEINMDQLIHQIQRYMSTDHDNDVFLPFGLAHPDHELVTLGGLEAAKTHGGRIFLWEDLPSRVLRPELFQPAYSHLTSRGWRLEYREFPRGDVDWKLAAIRCYSSQMWAVDWRSCLVPERYWEATYVG